MSKHQESQTAGSWWLCKPEEFYQTARQQDAERFSREHSLSYGTWGTETASPLKKANKRRGPLK